MASDPNRRRMYQTYSHLEKTKELLFDLRKDERALNHIVNVAEITEAIDRVARSMALIRQVCKDRYLCLPSNLKGYK